MTDTTPTITAGSSVSLDEAALPNGTRPGASPLTASGSFFLQASDGVAAATIDGHSFISGGVFTPITDVTPLGEQINLQSYDAATGQVTFTYTLNQAVHHAHSSTSGFLGAGDQLDAPVVVATGNDGVQATGTVPGLHIHDDTPIAGSLHTVITVHTAPTLTGNIFA
jgi:hypothetical protein